MATTVEHVTELAMNLRLSKQASEKLSQRAKKVGQDVSAVASGIIEQAVSQPSFQETSVAATDDNGALDLAEESLQYNPVPPRRSYTVQAVVIGRGRGVPAPFELDPE